MKLFLKRKVRVEKCGVVDDLKARYGINMKHTRCDNAGKNDDFKKVCKQEGRVVQFEYTTPDQLNYYTESLANYIKKIPAMAMLPWNSFGNDYKCYDNLSLCSV